jgi:hypothetical protein
MTDAVNRLIERAEALLARIEAVLPHPPAAPDWQAAVAFRYRRRGSSAALEPVRQLGLVDDPDRPAVGLEPDGAGATPGRHVGGEGDELLVHRLDLLVHT